MDEPKAYAMGELERARLALAPFLEVARHLINSPMASGLDDNYPLWGGSKEGKAVSVELGHFRNALRLMEPAIYRSEGKDA